MDEQRLEREIRESLREWLDSAVGSHPRWAASPAAERVGHEAVRTWRSGRLNVLWAAVLASLLLVTLLAAAVFVGAWRPDRQAVVIAPTPSPTPGAATPTFGPAPTAALASPAPLPSATPAPSGAPSWASRQPTGVETLTPESLAYERVVVDGLGTYWAIGPGHLTRFDPVTSARRTWTVSDDQVFGQWVVGPASAGGVWVGPQGGGRPNSIRRFDGTAFAEQVPVPCTPMDYRPVSVAPDGTLWSCVLGRWDGSAWVPLPAGGMGRSRVLGRDNLWALNPHGHPPAIYHFDGRQWTAYGPQDGANILWPWWDPVAAADGSVWIASWDGEGGARINRFVGGSWTEMPGPGFVVTSLAAAPDGSIWATAEDPVRSPPLARYADGRWTTYGAAEGVIGAPTGGVSVTPAGLFLGTTRGLLRFAGDRWAPAWPDAQPGPATPGAIAAVSRTDGWVVDGGVLWHHHVVSWDGPTAPPDLATPGATIDAVAVGPDGAVWVAQGGGVAVLRDGTWRTARTGGGARALAVDASGTAWANDGPDGGVVALSSDPTVPTRRFTCPNAATSLAVATDGTVFVGEFSTLAPPTGGLSRIDDTGCTAVDLMGDGKPHDVWQIAAGPDGRLAAVISEAPDDDENASVTMTIVLFDGSRWVAIDREGKTSAEPTVHFDPQGALWRLPFGGGLQRFNGTRFVSVPGVPVQAGISGLSIAADGTFWFVGTSGVGRFDIRPIAER